MLPFRYACGSRSSEYCQQRDRALATTIGLYALEEISLGKAAERTGVTRWEIVEVLEDAGIKVILGPQSMDDLKEEVDVALEHD